MLDANSDLSATIVPAAAVVPETAAAQGGSSANREWPAADEDQRLIAAWRAGDRGAMEQLYRRHADSVWRYARYFSGRDEAAGEILQDTFLRVIRHLSGFEGRARFSTWLFAVARSAAQDWLRTHRRGPTTGMADMLLNGSAGADGEDGAAGGTGDLAHEETPAQLAEAGETRAQVRSAIAKLPDSEREAIVLLELEGMSVQDAAEILGWTTAKTKVTVFRARRRLRDYLRPVLHPPETG